jgi:general secretion pathway protein K
MMRNSTAQSRFGKSLQRADGFIIVAVLWILMMLATLATIYSVYVSKSALALTANDAGIESELLASAGLELAAYQLLVPEKENRPTHGEFRVRIGQANLAVRYVSEAARIDLNEAPKPLLTGLFTVLGARAPDAERYADRIIGWRTEPKGGAQDKEASLYLAAGLSYAPRGAPIAICHGLWRAAGSQRPRRGAGSARRVAGHDRGSAGQHPQPTRNDNDRAEICSRHTWHGRPCCNNEREQRIPGRRAHQI